MRLTQCRSLLFAIALSCLVAPVRAGTVWDGGGAADADWTTPANWNGDTLPAFDGTEAITISIVHVDGSATQLDGNKDISSLITNPTSSYSINGGTLTIQSGNVTGHITPAATVVSLNSNVALGANATFHITGSGMMDVAGAISDGGNGFSLNKTGVGIVRLSGANSYTGQTRVNGLLYVNGNVAENVSGPLGNASSAVVIGQTADPATMALVTVGQTFGRDIEISAAGTGAVRVDSYASTGVSTISGDIIMNRDLTMYGNHNNNGYVNVTGVISGPGNLNVHRNIRLAAMNTYTGTTTIGEHPNFFTYLGADAPHGAPGAFGDATSDVVLASSGLFIDGAYTIGRNLRMTGNFGITQSGAGTGTINGNLNMVNPSTLTLSVNHSAGMQVFNGQITGVGGILRDGGQGLRTYLNNPNNSYTGTTEIRIGDVLVGADAPNNAPGALGNATSAVLFNQLVASHSSSLLTAGAFTIGRDINLANSAANSVTTLGGDTAHSSTFSGAISINENTTAALRAVSGGQVTFSGTLSGAGRISKVEAGNVVLSGIGNSFAGTATVTTGALIVAADSALGTTVGTTTVASGATLGFQGNVNYLTAETVNIGGLGSGSMGALRNFSGTNTFAGAVNITANSSVGADAGQLNLTGVLDDGAGTFSLTKAGTGTVNLASPTGNLYGGLTTINAGTLLVNNATGSATGPGSVQVNNSGTLGGEGSITGNVTAAAGGAIAPGNSAGNLTINGNVVFTNSTSQFVVELGQPDYDQLTVNGGVTLANATLDVSVIADIDDSAQLFILVNDEADPISGTFDGLANGSVVSLGEYFGNFPTAQISYFGDFATNSLFGGNDIVLYNFNNATSVPEPGTLSLLLLAIFGLRRRSRRV